MCVAAFLRVPYVGEEQSPLQMNVDAWWNSAVVSKRPMFWILSKVLTCLFKMISSIDGLCFDRIVPASFLLVLYGLQ